MTSIAKIKYYLFNVAKIVIAVVAFYFIYEKISNQLLDEIIEILSGVSVYDYLVLVLLILFSVANWFFEIQKWKLLSSNITEIDLKRSAKIVLSSFAASIITPNRIGEYGAKVMFYQKTYWKRVLGYNFIGNMMQLNVTLFMALSFYRFAPDVISDKIPEIVFYLSVLSFLILSVALFMLGFNKVLSKVNFGFDLKTLSKFSVSDRAKAMLLSLLRYIAFSVQLLLIFAVFGTEVTFENYSIITIYYLLVSVIPTVFLGDLLIRGSVAIFLFSLIGVNEIEVISVVFVAWIYNFVFPALFGSAFILKTKI